MLNFAANRLRRLNWTLETRLGKEGHEICRMVVEHVLIEGLVAEAADEAQASIEDATNVVVAAFTRDSPDA